MKLLLIGAVVLLAVNGYAATGDILGSSLVDTFPSDGVIRIRTSVGCVSGDCERLDYTVGASADFWDISITPTKEVTIVYYEKYSVWPLWIDGSGTIENTKSIRPFHGDISGEVTQNYMGATISAYQESVGHSAWYMSAWDGTANLTVTSAVTAVDTSPDGCVSAGGLNYTCPNARMLFKWSTDGGVTDGMGTNWREIRQYIKMPTDFTSADGEIKLWIDDVLLFTMTNLDMRDTGTANTTGVRLAPSDAAPQDYVHWYDDLIVYEGYVPPGGSTPTPPISGTVTLSASTTASIR